MNEFIIWDKGKERFPTSDNFLIDSKGFISNLNNEQLDENTYIPLYYIGKTDINDKKIFADSSIVESRITYDVGGTFETLRGWFRFNSERLNYEFIVPVNHNNGMKPREIYNYSKLHYKMSNLKVIGSLQENPELLKEIE